jgi:hypothetical protein
MIEDSSVIDKIGIIEDIFGIKGLTRCENYEQYLPIDDGRGFFKVQSYP